MVIVNMTEDFPVGILCAKKLFRLRTTFESEFLWSHSDIVQCKFLSILSCSPNSKSLFNFFHTDSRYMQGGFCGRVETKVAFGEQKRPLLMKIQSWHLFSDTTFDLSRRLDEIYSTVISFLSTFPHTYTIAYHITFVFPFFTQYLQN